MAGFFQLFLALLATGTSVDTPDNITKSGTVKVGVSFFIVNYLIERRTRVYGQLKKFAVESINW